jgi:hypothetical protein
MTNQDMGMKLRALVKHAICANWQGNRFLESCAARLFEDQQRIDDLRRECDQLREQVARLEERIAIITECEPGGDDRFPPEDDGFHEASVPGEAPLDFWAEDDFWD